MNTVALFLGFAGAATLLAAFGLAAGTIRISLGRRFHLWDGSWVVAALASIVLAAAAADLYPDPTMFTQTSQPPVPITVTHVTYLDGLLGRTDRMRVDTDRGIYFVTADAPIPRSGPVYRAMRERPWGGVTRTFLCLDRQGQACWPTLATDR